MCHIIIMVKRLSDSLNLATTNDERQFRKQVCDYLDPYVIKDSFYTLALFSVGLILYAVSYRHYLPEILIFGGLILFTSLVPLIVIKNKSILIRDLIYKISLSFTFLFGSFISGGIYSPIILFLPLLIMNTLPHALLIRSNLTNYIGIACCGFSISILAILQYQNMIPPAILSFEDQPIAVTVILITGIIKIGMVDHLVKIPVTKLKHIISLNKKLIEASDAALALNKSKATFMAQMSHELRTPLNAIIGFSEVMSLELFGHIPEAYKEYCDNINNSGKHLLTVVNNILDMARLEDGKYTPKFSSFSPYQTLMQIFALTKDLAQQKKINLDVDIKLNETEQFLSDEQAIKQILINLIGNSIKYCPPNVEIKLSLFENNEQLHFEIRDTGRGFSQQVLDNFGMPFNLGDTYLSENTKSTGLGLSITKALVEVLGGHIYAYNAATGGAVVSISLPAKRFENKYQQKVL